MWAFGRHGQAFDEEFAMKPRALSALSASLALALLAPPPAHAQSAEVFSQRLGQLAPMQRLATLRRAVIDAGNLCRRPSDASQHGRWKNLVMWSVRCTPGGDYAVFLGPSGYVQVRRCEQLRQLKLPQCTLPPAKPAAPAPRPRR